MICYGTFLGNNMTRTESTQTYTPRPISELTTKAIRTDFEAKFKPVPYSRVEDYFEAMDVLVQEPEISRMPSTIEQTNYLKYPSVSMGNHPSTQTRLQSAAMKLGRFLKIIPDETTMPIPQATPLNMEIKPFNVVKYVNIFHNENADLVNDESRRMHKNAWKWRHPRLASFVLMLSKTASKDMGHDLMILIDHSFELLRENEGLRIKKNRLHVNKEFFLNPYSNIGSFLSDIFITGNIPENYLRGEFSHDYMRKLGELWHKLFHLEHDALANLNHEKLREKYPEIPNRNWKELSHNERMTLFEQRIIFDRARKIKAKQTVYIQGI